MHILVTGSSGQVGRVVVAALEAEGHAVAGFDLADGQDLRDPDAVGRALAGCDVVVHAAALAHDTAGTPDDIMATNVLGTWHVLSAAERTGVGRVIVFSSGQVFGCAEGEGEPAWLPIDDTHPHRAARPYGLSKRLGEQMCEAWSTRTGTPTVVMRPVLVLDDASLTGTSREEAELGAFVHVDDVAMAVVLAVAAEVVPLHVGLTLCGPGPFDTSTAEQVLGWRARRGWPEPA
ncbi:MAG: NAD(P)-dependent oxidoreductase [Actinomycetota bacterium]